MVLEQEALAMHQLELGQKETADDKELRTDILEALDAEIEVLRNRQKLEAKAYAVETASDFSRARLAYPRHPSALSQR